MEQRRGGRKGLEGGRGRVVVVEKLHKSIAT